MPLSDQYIYRSPYPYIVNNFIREYDLSKANISSLLSGGLISVDRYNELYNMPKNEREVIIGIMSRDKNVLECIQNGIRQAKRLLFEANNIQDIEVVSIRNDAVFILGRELANTEFGYFKFNMKNKYTIFFKLCDLEVYFGSDYDFNCGIETVNIDVKGINDNKLELHVDGMLSIISDICSMLMRDDPSDTLRYLSDIYSKYITRQLPIKYYREFNSRSAYVFNAPVCQYTIDYELEDQYLNRIDINRNALILRDLINIVSAVYKSSIRHP